MSEYKSAKEFLEGMDWDEIRDISNPAELFRSIESSDRYDATLRECEEALEEALEEAQRRSPLRSQDGSCAESIGSRYGVFLPPHIVRQVEQLADEHIRCLVEDYFAKNGDK